MRNDHKQNYVASKHVKYMYSHFVPNVVKFQAIQKLGKKEAGHSYSFG